MKITIFFLARTIERWVKWMLILKGRFSKSYVAQSSKFCLRQQLFAFNEFYMETRLSNIFKTTNVTNFTKAILKSSYRVLEVTFKWKTLKQPVYFFKSSWILLYFWHSNWHNFDYISGKVAKPHILERPEKSLKHFNIHVNRAIHNEIMIP